MDSANSIRGVSTSSQADLPEIKKKLSETGTKKTGTHENKKGALASLQKTFSNLKAKISGGKIKAQSTISGPLTPEKTRAAMQNIREQSTSNRPMPSAKRAPWQSPNNKTAPSSSASTRSVVKDHLLIIEPSTAKDLPPPYSLHDLLGTPKGTVTTNDDLNELDDLLDDLAKPSPNKSATALKNENIKDTAPTLDEILQELEGSPPAYSFYDPINGPPPPSYIPTPPTQEQLDGPKPMDAQSLLSAITNGVDKAMQNVHGSKINDEDKQKFKDNLSIGLGFKQGEKLSMDQFSALGAMKLEVDPFLPPDVKSNFDALMHKLEAQQMKDLGTT